MPCAVARALDILTLGLGGDRADLRAVEERLDLKREPGLGRIDRPTEQLAGADALDVPAQFAGRLGLAGGADHPPPERLASLLGAIPRALLAAWGSGGNARCTVLSLGHERRTRPALRSVAVSFCLGAAGAGCELRHCRQRDAASANADPVRAA